MLGIRLEFTSLVLWMSNKFLGASTMLTKYAERLSEDNKKLFNEKWGK